MAVCLSGFYEWLGRAASQRSQDDARLTRLIRESFELSDRTYGSPRVWHDLRALGESCGLNRVARLMSQAKPQARRKRRRLPSDNVSRLENHMARITCSGTFRPMARTRSGQRTSPTSGRLKAGCMPQRSWTCTRAASWAGP
jgi:transposase InsO family protein